MEVIRNIKKCKDFSLAKAKFKNTSKDSGPKSTIPGERICFDKSYAQNKIYGVLSFGY